MEKIVTYRYIFSLKDSPDKYQLRIVSDTVKGHNALVDKMKAELPLERFAREYLSEIDVSRLLQVENLIAVELKK